MIGVGGYKSSIVHVDNTYLHGKGKINECPPDIPRYMVNKGQNLVHVVCERPLNVHSIKRNIDSNGSIVNIL